MGEELNYYYQTNWESTNDQNDPFESALSSMVSSPTGGGSNGGDHFMMMELIGRLGCITESNTELSCIATIGNNSTNTSCYSTPLNSPPKASSTIMAPAGGGGVNLPNYPPALLPLNADPGFVERAAKFSSFGLNNGCVTTGVNLECGKLSRVLSNKSMIRGGDGKFRKVMTPENGDFGDSREGSSVSEQNPVGQMGVFDGNSRKRKSFPKSKAKDFDNKIEEENRKSNAKRSKANDEEGKKQNGGECNNNTNNSNNNNKDKENDSSKEVAKAEPPKDYIHVRARRGQATDSHSLAERVRREKISERMKFLQDLVPGCNKVTGKATVLDEIINYVQSLQHQVEFLSMKLSTFNPRTEFNPESILSKDMFQSKGLSTMPQTIYQLEQNSAQALPHGYQPFQQLLSPLANIVPNGNENPFSSPNPSNVAGIRRNPTVQLPQIAGFGDAITQMPNFWEDDLQSIVQMGIVQNQTQSVPGTSPNAQMKVEQ